MSEAAVEPVRRWLLVRAALEVLSEESPLPAGEVIARVGTVLEGELNEYETAPIRPGGDIRWDTNLRWSSTDMAAAGWIIKDKDGWSITSVGRAALASHPEGIGLDTEASQAYREKHGAPGQGRQTGHYVPVLEAALEFLEPGQWTSYGDLATVASTNAQTVGNFTRDTRVDGAHRVLGKRGKPSPGFAWASDPGRKDTQRGALEAEGLVFDPSGMASEAQHVRVEDFRDYLEEKGVLVPPPRHAWLVKGSAVDGNDLVPQWLSQGFVSLRASKLREVESGISRPDLKAIIDEDYSQSSYAAKADKLDDFHAFLSRIQVDDVIATTSRGLLYLGRVTGDAEYVPSEGGLSNLRRDVDWQPHGHEVTKLASEIKARQQIQRDVVEMTQQLDLLEEMLSLPIANGPGTGVKPPTRELVLPDATQQLADGLNVDREWLQECIDLLRDRPQLIFYGPPGTGKTYIARHLAVHLAADNVRLVQFHPGYTYEDFFEGFRPLESGGFALKPGPLRKVVDAARENPSTPYVLIIDEINRGNLAKIFGELYFLLEYRSQNVDLLYATDDDVGFTLPENVYLLGTMNTADRSIALVDAAMRRRFAFVQLHPSQPPVNDILRRWLRATGRDSSTADLHDELNRRIDDPDFRIGPSYFMRPAVHQPGGLERAWRTAILPLLEEHHYGDGTDVTARYGLAAIQTRVEARAAADAAESHSDEPADPA